MEFSKYRVSVLFRENELISAISSPVEDPIIIFIQSAPLSQQDPDLRWFCFQGPTCWQRVIGFILEEAANQDLAERERVKETSQQRVMWCLALT